MPEFRRVVFQFAQRDTRNHSLALEWLETTLTGIDRAVVPLLEPGMADSERLSLLERWVSVPLVSRDSLLNDLIEDSAHEWRRPWLMACAMFFAAAGSHPAAVFVNDAADGGSTWAGHVEASIVHETLAGLRERATVE